MALIPVTFKHSSDEDKKKSGKVSPITARMLYANTFSGKVGIVKGYKRDESTDELSIGYDDTATTSSTFRLIFNKGAVSIYGGIGIIEQGTFYDIPKGLSNYSFGIRIDLTKTAGSEMEFYYKPASEDLVQQDLQINDSNGVYEFELCKITTTGAIPTVSEKTESYIASVEDYIEARLNQLGFMEGSIENSSGQPLTADKNVLTRQGNYVIGQLNFSSFYWDLNLETHEQTLSKVIGYIPKDFRPKTNITIPISIAYGGSATVTGRDGALNLYFYATITTDGVITAYAKAKSTHDDGWIYCRGNCLLSFGYEANPLERAI